MLGVSTDILISLGYREIPNAILKESGGTCFLIHSLMLEILAWMGLRSKGRNFSIASTVGSIRDDSQLMQSKV
jgi:hypothetical protein